MPENFATVITSSILEILGQNEEANGLIDVYSKKSIVCFRKLGRKRRYKCVKYNRNICETHRLNICQFCYYLIIFVYSNDFIFYEISFLSL